MGVTLGVWHGGQLSGSSLDFCLMSVLQEATAPLSRRPRCFLDNDDLGQLGVCSTRLYLVVSISLTLWAVWDPSVPGEGQWVGSPLALRRPFRAGHASALQSYGTHDAH